MALDPKRRAELEHEGARSRQDVEEWLADQDEKAAKRRNDIKQRARIASVVLIFGMLLTIVAFTTLR